jgi:type IV pilus assembly protein PilA
MEQSKKGPPVWVWFVVLLPVALSMLGIMAALSIYGVRRYIASAKQAEARVALTTWGDGLARCGDLAGKLPPTSQPVPPTLAQVSGKKYLSAPSDWRELAHTCAGFAMTQPQYFQYQWQQTADNYGVAHAVADLDADGAPDVMLDMDVTCVGRHCMRGTATLVSGASGSGSSRAPAKAAEPGPGLLAFVISCTLVVIAGGIWGLVVAFQESVGWGLLVMFVPCASVVFLAQHWQRAKGPFFLRLGAIGAMLSGLLVWAIAVGAFSSSPAGASPRGASAPPPPPTAAPLPPLNGVPVDLSTVMGRARKLANGWQLEAALLGVDASNVVGGKIQTQAGGVAKVTFGPSSFNVSQPRSGGLVVTYDEHGLSSASVKAVTGNELPEPMCGPELVYRRAAGAGQPSLALRYAFDSNRRPVWLALLQGQAAAQAQAFDAQHCELIVSPVRR